MTIHLVAFRPDRYWEKGAVIEATGGVSMVNPYDRDRYVLDGADMHGEGRTVMVENRYQDRRGLPIAHSLHFNGNDNVSNQPEVRGGLNLAKQGATAYLIPQASVLVGGEGAAAYRERAHVVRDNALHVSIGDLLVDEVMGIVLKIVAGGQYENTGVEIIEAPAATIDFSEFVAERTAHQKKLGPPSEAWLSG